MSADLDNAIPSIAPDREIRKLLVANRGEITRRIFRSAALQGITTVAIYSEPDAEAPFVHDADEAVPIGGVSAAESYLDVAKVLDAASRTGADAIHPGYGFLAENAAFARAVESAGMVWVGPPADAIDAMGSKVEARRKMQDAGVPVVPGAELEGSHAINPDAALAEIGLPLLVKASAGGGGKGMRIVREANELGDAIDGARREAESSFGDGNVFLERYVERPRHVEIQIFADEHGNTVSLGERECSIQRRHQKVIEEAPSPAVNPELRKRMGDAAVAAAEVVGYVGAGTVEFLLGDDGEFFFLEMNTRLQVEHPVTEMVTGLDLVRLQLLVAMGEPLPAEVHKPTIHGHSIEVRLYAEDPATDFLPQTGTVGALEFAGAEPFAAPSAEDPDARAGLRLDSGIESGNEVSPHYDPMIAKVICWAPTRAEAASRLADAMRRASVHGLVTNRDFLVRTLMHSAFLYGATDTGFIERHSGLTEPLVDDLARPAHVLAAVMAAMAARRAEAPVQPFTAPGWRNNRAQPQLRTYIRPDAPDEPIEVGYVLGRAPHGAGQAGIAGAEIEATVGEADVSGARIHSIEVGGADQSTKVELEVGGIRRSYAVRTYAPAPGVTAESTVIVNSTVGQLTLHEQPRYAGGDEALGEGALAAPMPGKVIKIKAAEGDQIEAGDVIVVLEAMKMEHELTAPASGVLTRLAVAEGDQVDPGSLLAEIDTGEESSPPEAGSS